MFSWTKVEIKTHDQEKGVLIIDIYIFTLYFNSIEFFLIFILIIFIFYSINHIAIKNMCFYTLLVLGVHSNTLVDSGYYVQA
jgi:hypothetical protein